MSEYNKVRAATSFPVLCLLPFLCGISLPPSRLVSLLLPLAPLKNIIDIFWAPLPYCEIITIHSWML